MRPDARNRGGFTLVEMVSVILIMAILIGIVSTGLSSARENVWRTRARDTARQIVDAWNLYLLDQREFPERKDLLVGRIEGDVSKMDVGIPVTLKALKPLRPEKGSKYIELSFDELYEHKKGTAEDEMSGVGGGNTRKADNAVALADRWGQPLYFELDFDYDGYCEAPSFIPDAQGESSDGKDTRSKVKANAVSWSPGPPARKGKKWVAAWK